jgi:hypothetical protein
MKKLITQASAVVFAFAFMACSSEDLETGPEATGDTAEESEDFSPDPSTEDGGEESAEE